MNIITTVTEFARYIVVGGVAVAADIAVLVAVRELLLEPYV